MEKSDKVDLANIEWVSSQHFGTYHIDSREGSDEPVHVPSLIRAFNACSYKVKTDMKAQAKV